MACDPMNGSILKTHQGIVLLSSVYGNVCILLLITVPGIATRTTWIITDATKSMVQTMSHVNILRMPTDGFALRNG